LDTLSYVRGERHRLAYPRICKGWIFG